MLQLFPRAWRERYADEFLALLEQRPPSVRDLLDIFTCAFDARVRPRAWQPEQQPVPVANPVVARAARPPATSAQLYAAAERRFTRRTFLRNAVLGGVIVSTAGMTGGAVYFAWPNKTSPFGSEVIVPRSEVPAPGDPPRKFDEGKFYLSADSDGVLALYWKCPHLGCTVPWEPSEDQFHCPCHQSLYDRHGAFRSGPAPRSMDLMALRFDAAGNAIVHTGQLTQRDTYSPDQAVMPPS
jgi:cytochrome b6-f complex iron-sulfur subunit